ncbi:helix-turn-helix domain-containing protein [Streptomyces alfalfae]
MQDVPSGQRTTAVAITYAAKTDFLRSASTLLRAHLTSRRPPRRLPVGAREQLSFDLLRLREYREWTLDELAAKTGLSRATLTAATQGTICPSWETMTKYLTACGEDPDAWRPRWELVAEQHQRDNAGLPQDQQQREAFRRIKPEEIQTLHDFAVALRQLKVWQNQPTYGQISRTATRAGFSVRGTTICNAFGGTKLPTESALLGVLVGMGLNQEDPEIADWLEAHRRRADRQPHPCQQHGGQDPAAAAPLGEPPPPAVTLTTRRRPVPRAPWRRPPAVCRVRFSAGAGQVQA